MQRHGPVVLLVAAAACGGRSSHGDPVRSALTIEGEKVSVEDARTLRVVLRDSDGLPMPGEPVSWDVSGETNHIIPIDEVTDADGVAQAWYSTMTAEAKTARVRAGPIVLARTFRVDPGRPGIYSTVALQPPCVPADGETEQTVVVSGRDLYANATPDAAISVRLLHVGPQIVEAPARADFAGIARIRVVSMAAGRFPFIVDLGSRAILRELCFF